jgi:prolyl-tRNA editing enzyme YbaK/EbsC (Cys-tRNA(Pro) deacylase)
MASLGAKIGAVISQSLSTSSQKVQDVLIAQGFTYQVFELEVPVKTAQQAAEAVRCDVARIAKSLVFKSDSGNPVLIIASGINRVSEQKIAVLLGQGITRADPDFVRTCTGFAIGGIPPLGHAVQPVVLLDEDLLLHPSIWAAAGHPNSLFELEPQELPRMTHGRFADVKV